jgi:ABC-type phosphate transport system substrate-binding protein
MQKLRILTASGIVCAAAMGWTAFSSDAGVARADEDPPPCADLGTPVYIAGASAVRPQIREGQRALARAGSDIVMIYQGTASCDGPSAILNDLQTTSQANYYDYSADINADNPIKECTLPLEGVRPDIGISDVLAATCEKHLGGDFGLGPDHREYQGAVQAMVFAAQHGSTENAISAEAARVVLGFGGETHTVSPWTVNAELHNRVSESGTKITMAEAIGLLSTKWQGIPHPSNPNVLEAILAASNPNAAIGLLAADFADKNRDQLKVLALQMEGQRCGYLPDSSSTSLDKVNVREGRYGSFAPMRFLVDVDSSGQAVARGGRDNHEAVRSVLQFLRMENLDEEDMRLMIQASAQASTVPLCAMKVERTGFEGEVPTPYEPDEPCHCLYESFNGTPPGHDSCAACETDGDCSEAAPVCRFGFCEER